MGRCFRLGSARGMAVLAGVLALGLVAGCYERVSDGNQSVYRFAWWIGPTVIGAGILGIPLGWFLRKASAKWGVALMILGPILLGIVAPAMYSDRVVVDDEHFEATYGFWFSPSVHNLQFRDLREIRYVAVPGRKGRTNYELHCATHSGAVTVVHAGNLVKNTVPEILARARARGVIITGETP